MNNQIEDLAGKAYWHDSWTSKEAPIGVNPRAKGLNNYVNRNLHDYFSRMFVGIDTRRMKLLEIGCGASSWLSYFAKEFGFEIQGLDYSDLGCEKAQQVLDHEGVRGTIVCADLFSPPAKMVGTFDVLVSFGVAEHFKDTVACLQAISRFVRPGGRIITMVPNLVGLVGWLQRTVDHKVYDVHVALDRGSLSKAHENAGLRVVSCDYFLFMNLGVVNIHKLKRSAIHHEVISRLCSWISKTCWIVGAMIPVTMPNRWTSPYVICQAIKNTSGPI